MPYIGNPPVTQFASLDYQDLTGVTGVPAKRGYTLNNTVGGANDIEVFVNNVRQEPGVAYTVSGTTLTMTGDVETTDDFYVVFQGKSIGTATHPANNALEATTGTFSSAVNTGTIKEVTGSTTALTIDSSGRVLTPANPKFSVRLNTGTGSQDYTAVATSNVPLDTEDFDVGSCVAISGSGVSSVATFTAPITGYYQFNLVVQFSGSEGAGHVNTYLSVDGSTTSAANDDDFRAITDPEGGTYTTLGTSFLISLTAGQTVNPKLFISGDTAVEIRKGTRFSGFLVP